MSKKKNFLKIIYLNLFLLFNNIIFVYQLNYKSFYFKFKNIDIFFIKNIFNNEIFNILHKKRKTISLFFVDNHHYSIYDTINLLKKKYYIKISKNNPDYLIYNVFGCKHMKSSYKNSIKIAIFTENQIPDFNIADYAVSNSHIYYLDRNFNNPYYFIKKLKLINNKKLNNIRNKLLSNPKRKKFCAAVISNSHFTDYFRLNFIKKLNEYKKIDMGGRYKNNVGKINNKIKFLSSYKFSIAMENTEGDGYVSEKIIDSFLSGSIPIYYGDYMIDEYINPKSIILVRGNKDMKKKIAYIKYIDNNKYIYKNILKEKILIDDNILKKLKKELQFFLFHIFEKDKRKAKRTTII